MYFKWMLLQYPEPIQFNIWAPEKEIPGLMYQIYDEDQIVFNLSSGDMLFLVEAKKECNRL